MFGLGGGGFGQQHISCHSHTPATAPLPSLTHPPAFLFLFFLQVKVWDLRMLRPLHAYYSPAPADWCDVSQRGLLAVGYGRRIQVCAFLWAGFEGGA